MSLVEKGRGVLHIAHVVQVVLVDGEHPVANCDDALLGRHAAGADPADVYPGVQGNPVVRHPGSEVEDCLVPFTGSPPPDDQRHGAARTPQGGQDCRPVHVPTVQIVDTEDAVIDFQFPIHDGAFVDGCDVDWAVTWTHRIIATPSQVQTEVLVVADASHVDVNSLRLPVLQVRVYSRVSAVAVAGN